MEIYGIITTGLGKGAYFLGKDFYKSKFSEKCGFIPFPGTLNVIIPEKYVKDIERIKVECKNIIKAKEGFGGIKYIKAKLTLRSNKKSDFSEVNGAIVFPEKTSHDANYLEFIAKDNLREKLELKDGDEVKLNISL